ncbi:MAG: discoidin domain-containing protein [Chthoniobacteraceae bacterium]|jgi:hypothetical protein
MNNRTRFSKRIFGVALWFLLGLLILEPGLLEAAGGAETNLALNRAAYQSSAINYDNVAHLATDGSPETYWQSRAEDRPWIFVDLGQVRKFSGIRLNWGFFAPRACTIQVSDGSGGAFAWKDIAHASCSPSTTTEIACPQGEARCVRMIADAKSAPNGCQLKEFMVEGALPPAPPAAPLDLSPKDQEDKISFDGAGWKIQNAMFVPNVGEDISQPSFSANSWLPAQVPGTALVSYLKAGAIPDPDFGDQQRLISESFFQNDFWYRREFLLPAILPHQHFILNFDGINWKADIYLNGSRVGHIDGAFIRGKFDVTHRLLPGQKNVLAVLIHKTAHPGPTNEKSFEYSTHSGGVLGKDSPTFLASAGWNWVPSIRGRDIGIWDHVYLEQTGPAILVDPFVKTLVSNDLSHADLTIQVTVKNLEDKPLEGALAGGMDGVSFTRDVRLQAKETKTLILDKTSIPQLGMANPRLWWPNGYGAQPLYHLNLSLAVNHDPSSQKEITFGIRTLTYDTSYNTLKILCNGRRIQLNGGNWGMDEAMLRYDAKDYDTAVRMHKEMNMTIIRNWVGQVGKEEFFDACDKYGLLVWNDFWIANPTDGPNPDDHGMFMNNVRDRILRIRNHPSLALYCGRNESKPPADLDEGIARETAALDGTRYYISQSDAGLVTGHAFYEPHPASWYFKNKGVTLQSEMGIVCVPTADSMRLMLPREDLWPINDVWALHDFFQPRCRTYTARIDNSYGPSQGLDEFCEKAQLENLENAKAIFECWRGNSGSGVIMWMTQPAWPSLICQLYDCYLNPTAAYFGAKKANEPLHILWDPLTNRIKVANDTGRNFAHLKAEASIFNLDGTQKSHQEADVDSPAGGMAVDCFELNFPSDLDAVHFIKLKLTRDDGTVSENFYWRGATEDNFLALNQMAKVALTGSVTETESDGGALLDVHLKNPTSHVALMTCLKVVRSSAPDERILPIFYEDNYISLLPGESREIHIEFDSALLKGDRPMIMVNGWNVMPKQL